LTAFINLPLFGYSVRGLGRSLSLRELKNRRTEEPPVPSDLMARRGVLDEFQ